MALPRYPPHKKIKARDLNLIGDYLDSILGSILPREPNASVTSVNPPALVTSVAGTGSIVAMPSVGDVLIADLGGGGGLVTKTVNSSSLNGSQSLAYNATTQLPFNFGTNFDGHGNWKAPATGLYYFSLTAEVSSNATGGTLWYEMRDGSNTLLRRFYSSGIFATGRIQDIFTGWSEFYAVGTQAYAAMNVTKGTLIKVLCGQQISSGLLATNATHLDIIRLA